MKQCSFRLYASLNDFLPAGRKAVEFAQAFVSSTTLKDMFEALGMAHTEIDLVLVNGTPSALTHIVHDADRISVFSWFFSIQLEDTQRLRPTLLCEARFVCDTHLGRLAAYLRMLGFDTLYRNDLLTSAQEQRVLLTRDRALLKLTSVVHGYLVRAMDPRQQLHEISGRFDLLRPHLHVYQVHVLQLARTGNPQGGSPGPAPTPHPATL